MLEVKLTPELKKEHVLETTRNDRWWFEPFALAALAVIVGIYLAFAIIVGNHFTYGHYISPLYAPDLKEFGINLSWWPTWLSASFILVWAPIGFRATCYYMRRFYYRSFFLDPPACAVAEIGKLRASHYNGETRFPFVLNNFHRYFLYLAIILALLHWTDVFNALKDPSGGWGIGVGTIIVFLDALFLTLYVGSCHSFRHLIGGSVNCYGCSKFKQTQYKGWRIVSRLNEHHNHFFWISFLTVFLADLNIRALSMGFIHDIFIHII